VFIGDSGGRGEGLFAKKEKLKDTFFLLRVFGAVELKRGEGLPWLEGLRKGK